MTPALPLTLLTELAGMPDARVMLDLPRLLTKEFQVDLAYIGMLQGTGQIMVAAQHISCKQPADSALAPEDYRYDVPGSPCAMTIRQGRFAIAEGCCDTFDRVPDIQQLKVRGYAGVSLQGDDGTVCGVLVILTTQRLADADRLLAVLELSGKRVSSVLAAGRKLAAHREETTLLRSLLNAVPYPVFCKNPEGRYLECNTATEKIFGRSRQELLQQSMREVAPRDLISECYETECQLVSGEKSDACHEGPLTLPGGEVRKFRCYKSTIQPPGDKHKTVACSFLDITQQEQAYTELEQKQHFLQSVIDNIVDPIMVVGLDKRVMLLNKQAMQSVSPAIADRTDLVCRDVCRAAEMPCRNGLDACPVDKVLKTGEVVTLLQQFVIATGATERFETIASPLRNDHDQIVGVVHWSRNVSERTNLLSQLDEQEQRLHFLAYHDHLTQLPNRLNLQERLHRAISRGRRDGSTCALMFVDLDRFKVINDSLGHDIGDLVLKKVADNLKQTIRETDTVARFGGDEFLVLLEGLHEPSQASLIARKILSLFERPIKVRDIELFLTASIGICLALQDGHDSESMIKNSEIAMYRGKDEGRNTCTFYNRAMDCLAHDRLEQQNDLRKAIENNEIHLYYQPQIDFESRRICGFEGLLRWVHPEKGIIFPAHFIPLAEETGLIVALGEWCLEQACRFICRLNSLGMSDFRVAVNISPRHFRQKGLVDKIVDTLKETGVDPGSLELEITEGTLMEDVDTAIAKMTSLRQMGVALTIDDFGIGYSSLNYLKKFPVTQLKIDKSFVAGICEKQQDSTLVSMIIALAKSLGLTALAEGVETEFQLACLLKLGCTQIQGFLFSEALSEPEALQFAEEFNV
jgi:diguanylate cyclase (GGDEF)-like protein/PAS domain S-box-containing protein